MTLETPICFLCKGTHLVGLLHRAPESARRGLVIVVGGPQYRVGSHRQFLLLARAVAEAGMPVLRFDCRGMGDSEGPFAGFEGIDHDIAAAVDTLCEQVPGIQDVVLWGLCDAASAILFYAHRDDRISGVALLNPWVRTGTGMARAYLRHYYLRRLVHPAFWRKLAKGGIDLIAAGGSLLSMLKRASGSNTRTDAAHLCVGANRPGDADPGRPLPERMGEDLRRFRGRVLIILSGRDLTAKEFEDAVAASSLWRELLRAERVTRHRLTSSDHTFSRRAWRDQVAAWTIDWLKSW